MSPQSINQSDNIQDFNFGYQNTTNQNSEASPSSRNAWMETSQPQTPADKPGVTRPKYREYSFEQTRFASFTGWPSQMKQKPEVLAQAGFFYLGMYL